MEFATAKFFLEILAQYCTWKLAGSMVFKQAIA